MKLKEKLQAEKLLAMKAKRGLSGEELAQAEARLSAVRAALTAVAKLETSFKERRELSEDEIVAAIRKEVAQRHDSAAAYTQAGQDERSQRELQEALVLEAFLPTLLDETATRALVEAIIREQELSGPRAIGQVMGELKARSDVDKKLASKIAREAL